MLEQDLADEECIKPTDRVFSKRHEIIYISIAYSDDEESEDDTMF